MKKDWRRINSVEELVHVANQGLRVRSDVTTLLEHPRKAESVMGFSSRALVRIIGAGLYYEAEPDCEGAEPGTLLGRAQTAIRATGLSSSELSDMVGVTRQAVNKFLTSKSVQTRVLDRYLKATGVKI